jgi:hypothetical protein
MKEEIKYTGSIYNVRFIEFSYSNLGDVIRGIKAANGGKDFNFDDVDMEPNYDDCYYEGDTPSIEFILKKRINLSDEKEN